MKYILGVGIMIWSMFSSAKDYPQVEVMDEDGFVDLTFKIFEERNAREFIVKGSLNGVKVGFGIELQEKWSPQKVEGLDQPFYWGEAFFKSIGSDSQAFINILAGLYGAKLSNYVVHEKVYAQVVGLACNPGDLKNQPCKTKFFFNPDGGEEIYSEVFVNIDLDAGTLEFNEKDNDYRGPLLRSLLQ